LKSYNLKYCKHIHRFIWRHWINCIRCTL